MYYIIDIAYYILDYFIVSIVSYISYYTLHFVYYIFDIQHFISIVYIVDYQCYTIYYLSYSMYYILDSIKSNQDHAFDSAGGHPTRMGNQHGVLRLMSGELRARESKLSKTIIALGWMG